MSSLEIWFDAVLLENFFNRSTFSDARNTRPSFFRPIWLGLKIQNKKIVLGLKNSTASMFLTLGLNSSSSILKNTFALKLQSLSTVDCRPGQIC